MLSRFESFRLVGIIVDSYDSPHFYFFYLLLSVLITGGWLSVVCDRAHIVWIVLFFFWATLSSSLKWKMCYLHVVEIVIFPSPLPTWILLIEMSRLSQTENMVTLIKVLLLPKQNHGLDANLRSWIFLCQPSTLNTPQWLLCSS